MKVRFVFFAFVIAGILAAAAMGGALWIVALSYGDLGDTQEQRKRHLHASVELVRMMQPVTRAEAGAASAQADAIRAQWQETGASDEELKLLGETLATRLQLRQVAAGTMHGAFEALKGEFIGSGGGLADRAFTTGTEHEATQAKLVHNVSRLIEMSDARTNRGMDAALQQLGNAIGFAIGAVALMLLLTIAAALALKRSMVLPISRLARDVEGISKRDKAAPLDAGTRIAEFQTLAKGYNDLTQALEDEIRARLRMTVELQKARSAAEAAARDRDALLVHIQDQHEANEPQPALARDRNRNV